MDDGIGMPMNAWESCVLLTMNVFYCVPRTRYFKHDKQAGAPKLCPQKNVPLPRDFITEGLEFL